MMKFNVEIKNIAIKGKEHDTETTIKLTTANILPDQLKTLANLLNNEVQVSFEI